MSTEWFLSIYFATFLVGALLIDTFAIGLRVQLAPVLFLVLTSELALLCSTETT